MIVWLNDYYLFHGYEGGAILTDRKIFTDGVIRGMKDLILMTPESFDEEIVKSADLIIFSITRNFKKSDLEKCMRRDYVVFIHDYFCRWILYYPMLEKCKKCKYLNKDFYMDAMLLIWLSPLHRDAWLYSFPELEDKDYILVPSAVDINKFYSKEKEKDSVVLCNPVPFKGYKNVMEYIKKNKSKKFYIYGEIYNLEKYPSNVVYLGKVPNRQIPEILADKEYALHLPDRPMPCERFAIETLASGCKPIFNKNVGLTSYKEYPDKILDLCARSSDIFWNGVKKYVS